VACIIVRKHEKVITNAYDWPEVPEAQRPRRLPFLGVLDPESDEHLRALGWDPVDTRLLPSNTIEERSDAILAWLEGVRLGTITPQQNTGKLVELEMRACGLHTGKRAAEKPPEEIDDNMDDLLNFGKGEKPWQERVVE
jgi:hypothetical protein